MMTFELEHHLCVQFCNPTTRLSSVLRIQQNISCHFVTCHCPDDLPVCPAPSGQPVSNHVIDNGSGSFRIEFTPMGVGKFNFLKNFQV